MKYLKLPLLFMAAFVTVTVSAEQPNVIVVMTDDQGYGELSVHGNPILKTPHLDRLHSQSVRLTDFHVAPMCTPTRGQLLTGVDAARNAAINVSAGRTMLRASLPTMADFFKSNGYRTGIFGKWHLGDNYPFRPQDRGFEETLWFPSSHINSVPDYWNNDYFDDTFMVNGKRKVMPGYCTDVYFEEAMKWMKEKSDSGESFFTYIPTNAPHGPHWSPEMELNQARKAMEGHALPQIGEAGRESFAGYLGMILNVDNNMGRLMEFLEKEDLADGTILIYQTDNGSTFGERYFNAGMRGRKTQLWEGGHRVPFFLRWPGGDLGKPRDIDGVTQVQDVLPTLMDLCGLVPSEAPKFDGISLAPFFREKSDTAPEDRMVVINYSRMPFGFEFAGPDSPSVMYREGAGVMWGPWRLLEDKELYNLENDPGQKKDVIKRYPEVAAKMSAFLDDWWDEVGDIANEPQLTIIGNEAENPSMLTACEWLDVFVDQQGQIRRGVEKNGWWELEVAEAGTYEFELRRWPRETDTAIGAGLPAIPLTAGDRGPGAALPIKSARIQIGRESQSKQVKPKDKSVTFTYELEAGPTRLYTWFEKRARVGITGAYYVYVNKK
ncbi:MAG: arylsulfatase [Opitutaceae bacterium]|nr:arylsulfatase [Opitutaceae bacterium]